MVSIMSWRSPSSPPKSTRVKSLASVRLKNATSPFFAASMKVFSAVINVCSSGVSGLAGALACPAKAKPQHSRIMTPTMAYFIPVSLLRLFRKQFVTLSIDAFAKLCQTAGRTPERFCHSEQRSARRFLAHVDAASRSTNPRRQVPARHLHLFTGLQILHGERVSLHFILADNQDVLRARLRGRFKRLFQPEGVIS